MIDVFPIYEQLWRRAESEGVWVHYQGISFLGEAGYFHSRHDTPHSLNPMIALIRPYYIEPRETPRRERQQGAPVPPPNLVDELATLAHEYGHWRSFAGRTPRDEWDRYYAVALKRPKILDGARAVERDPRTALHEQLTDDERERIMCEEQLAWTVGREVLHELGLDDAEFWMAFDRHEDRGLHNHRYRLGIDELRPDDS